MKKFIVLSIFILTCILPASAQKAYSLQVEVTVSKEILKNFSDNGRLFLFVADSRGREPRFNTWPNLQNKIFALNLEGWNGSTPFVFTGSKNLTASVDASLDALPEGNYRVQVLWDQDTRESGINAPGNLYSEAASLDLSENKKIKLELSKSIAPTQFAETDFLKLVDIKSDVVSEFWNKEMHIKAAVLLPSGYHENPEKSYPVRYNIAGYGGRYTRAQRYSREGSSFYSWWMSGDAPQIINVYLDGEGPFGDCYQLDSENSGPYGTALTQELIPFIEKRFRAIGTPESRFVDGCSTGGWVSLALQLFYPDFFNGCFSYSPDQVDFEFCQLVNIYQDENAFYNEYGYLTPIVRNIYGQPIVSQKDFIRFENVLGSSNTYLNSGGQFSAFTALFSPKGENGLPKPMFDPVTGVIDHEVAKYWERHDLKRFVENNWETLGPKIQGKIWVWGADMDNFYLNPALRSFDTMLKQMTNPESDAIITFTPMTGHCQEYDQVEVLKMIAKRWKKFE